METPETWGGSGARVQFVKVEGLVPGGALSEREAAVYAAFRMEKRRSEWLAGRLAAKTLMAGLAATVRSGRAGGEDLARFEIASDLLGRPSCGNTLLSISHSNGWALAAVKPGSAFLGADLEKVEERHPAWYSDYFHPAELPTPDPSEGTRLWAIKEALMKALGLGLMADPLDIKAAGEIKFSGKTLERYKEMGSPAFTVETRAFPEGFWTAVAADKQAA
jgi:4'-phosphopantetheinyl transferase